MNELLSNFLNHYTFRRQISIAVAVGILLLAILSSVAGAWLGTNRVRDSLMEQGRNITGNLARQSALALLYASADNAGEATRTTMGFPGVVGVEICDQQRKPILMRGRIDLPGFPSQPSFAGLDGRGSEVMLEAESSSAWRFVAPVYSEVTSSPFVVADGPELLGYVTVVMSKTVLEQMSSSIIIANLVTTLFFALLFLFLIGKMSERMSRPLEQLSHNMRRAEQGDLQVRAELDGPRDIADMAHAFNSMMMVLEIRQREINQLNVELERRVVERTTELATVNQELEAFSYSVSHDLRTPLRAIDGFSGILQQDHAGQLDEEGLRLLKVVRENTTRMSQLIDDILQFSRTGRLELKRSRIDMDAMVRTVFEELPLQDKRGGLRIEIGHLPQVMGDSAMLRQVLINLLSNAIKFSGKCEAPLIEVGGEVQGDEVVYHVKDNGVGFDMQYADMLFGVFHRLHGVNEFQGTGIGLAIVKRIVTRHGGRVWAESKVGEGATFYFALPGSAVS
jgi:signal transduction histidine kinase